MTLDNVGIGVDVRYCSSGVIAILRYVCASTEPRSEVCHPATGEVSVAPPSVLLRC